MNTTYSVSGPIILIFGVVIMALGGVLGRLSSKRDGAGAGFASMGFATGLCLGLSNSPVIGSTITAILTLMGVVIPILLARPPAVDPETRPAPGPGSNWLFPLATMLTVGVILGIFVRVNDALNLQPNLRERYKALGYTEAQADLLMSRAVLENKPLAANGSMPGSSLQASTTTATMPGILLFAVKEGDSPRANLDRVKGLVPPPVLAQIRGWENQGKDPAMILAELKKLP